jgi:hypothetical protein
MLDKNALRVEAEPKLLKKAVNAKNVRLVYGLKTVIAKKSKVFALNVIMTTESKGPFVRPTKVADVKVIRTMCGTVMCKRCSNQQDACQGQNEYPIKDYAFKCNVCSNLLTAIINSDKQ